MFIFANLVLEFGEFERLAQELHGAGDLRLDDLAGSGDGGKHDGRHLWVELPDDAQRVDAPRRGIRMSRRMRSHGFSMNDRTPSTPSAERSTACWSAPAPASGSVRTPVVLDQKGSA